MIKANLEGHHRLDGAQAPTPTKMLPRPQSDVPVIRFVSPEHTTIANLQVVSGRFFDERETEAGAPVAVLGEGAAASVFGADDPIGAT